MLRGRSWQKCLLETLRSKLRPSTYKPNRYVYGHQLSSLIFSHKDFYLDGVISKQICSLDRLSRPSWTFSTSRIQSTEPGFDIWVRHKPKVLFVFWKKNFKIWLGASRSHIYSPHWNVSAPIEPRQEILNHAPLLKWK